MVEKHEKPRSYLLQTHDGEMYRRNRKHLLKTKETSFQNSHIQDSFDPVTNDCIPDVVSALSVSLPITTPGLLSSTPEVFAEETVKVTHSGRVDRRPQRYSC